MKQILKKIDLQLLKAWLGKAKGFDWLPSVSLAIIAGSLCRVVLSGRALLYVHPRTLIWVQLGVILLALLVLLSVRITSFHLSRWQRFAGAVTAVILLLMPSVSLSPSFAKNRDAGELLPTIGQKRVQVSGASSQFDLLEWIMAFEGDPTRTKYVGARANITGFVGERDGKPTLNRYLVTCCAVDAQLISLGMGMEAGVSLPTKGSWVTVTGQMQNEENKPLLKVSSLKEVPEPRDVYLY